MLPPSQPSSLITLLLFPLTPTSGPLHVLSLLPGECSSLSLTPHSPRVSVSVPSLERSFLATLAKRGLFLPFSLTATDGCPQWHSNLKSQVLSEAPLFHRSCYIPRRGARPQCKQVAKNRLPHPRDCHAEASDSDRVDKGSWAKKEGLWRFFFFLIRHHTQHRVQCGA